MATLDLKALPESVATAVQLVRAMIAAGVREVFYCPGSRCAPFAYALAGAENAGQLKVFVHIEERGAGFAALGLAKASGRPVAVITTSGSAVANLHPAMMEASAAGIALLALTADRPTDLVGAGANQTGHQTGIFGPQITTVSISGRIASGAARLAMRRALGRGFGPEWQLARPGHINTHFDLPLQPEFCSELNLASYFQQIEPDQVCSAQFAPAFAGAQFPQLDAAHLAIIAGDGAARDLPDLAELCERAQIPLLAEPSSGVRAGKAALSHYQDEQLLQQFNDVIVVGHPTLSRPISRLLARARVHVVAGVRGLADSARSAITLLAAEDLRSYLSALAAAAAPTALAEIGKREVRGPLTQREAAASAIWDSHRNPAAPPLLLGASAVIRAFDRVASPAASATGPIYANRGLAGIDGTIATACGIAIAHNAPTRAVIGDLTFLHDIPSLALADSGAPACPPPPLQLIVLNDQAGGIFRSLEHAAAPPALFSRYFLTPRPVNLAAIAAAYGYEYTPIEDISELAYIAAAPIRSNHLVEVFINDEATQETSSHLPELGEGQGINLSHNNWYVRGDNRE